MKEKSNKVCLTYREKGDYLIPNLVIDDGKVRPKLGKYGRMRLNFLKSEMKAVYTKMLMDGTLKDHLLEVEARATDMENMYINYMKKEKNIDEKLKESNQMELVREMNSIAHSAREIVYGKCINTYNMK